MMRDNECVVAIFPSLSAAQHAVQHLDASGTPHGRVSLVTKRNESAVESEPAVQYGDKGEENMVKAAGVGGLVGGLLGSPLLAIPGVGPLLLAGPIATGAIVGGFLGGMSGWGVHDDHVQQYEQRVREGQVLVMVHGPPDEVARAQQLLQETRPVELHLHAESSSDSLEVDDRPL